MIDSKLCVLLLQYISPIYSRESVKLVISDVEMVKIPLIKASRFAWKRLIKLQDSPAKGWQIRLQRLTDSPGKDWQILLEKRTKIDCNIRL